MDALYKGTGGVHHLHALFKEIVARSWARVRTDHHRVALDLFPFSSATTTPRAFMPSITAGLWITGPSVVMRLPLASSSSTALTERRTPKQKPRVCGNLDLQSLLPFLRLNLLLQFYLHLQSPSFFPAFFATLLFFYTSILHSNAPGAQCRGKASLRLPFLPSAGRAGACGPRAPPALPSRPPQRGGRDGRATLIVYFFFSSSISSARHASSACSICPVSFFIVAASVLRMPAYSVRSIGLPARMRQGFQGA